MNKYSNIVLLLCALVVFSACRKSLSKEDYAAFVTNPENGLRKTENLGDIELSVLYEPADYLLSREFETGGTDQAESRKIELDQYEHFQFRLKLSRGGNILKYREDSWHNENSRINHFSFDAQRDFQLVDGSDTLPCKIALYSRNYNLTPTIDLSLTFERSSRENDLRLVYTDSEFGIGKTKFLFKQEDIENAPELK